MIDRIDFGPEIRKRLDEGERKEVEEIIRQGEERTRKILDYDFSVEYRVEFDRNEYVNRRMRGVTGRIWETEDEADIMVLIWMDPEVEDWRKGLKTIVPHETAETQFYISKGKHYSDYRKWENLLRECVSQLVAEKVEPEIEVWWRTEYLEEEIAERWNKVKEELEKEMDYEDMPLFFGNSEEFPEAFGYCIAYRIGKELCERYDLNHFHMIEKEEVIEAGNKLFC